MDKQKNWLLRPDDQFVICFSLAIFLVVSGAYFWHRSVVNEGLVDFDEIPYREAHFLVEINSAPWQEFANLPGIGEKLAKEIVAYRVEIGQFDDAQQLVEVRGVGKKKLHAIAPHLFVNRSRQNAVLPSQ